MKHYEQSKITVTDTVQNCTAFNSLVVRGSGNQSTNEDHLSSSMFIAETNTVRNITKNGGLQGATIYGSPSVCSVTLL